jgi:REP element-mobilizing transposase RayT
MPDSLRLHRKSIRLPDFDYTSAGGYFITLVATNNSCLFGEMIGQQVSLNPFGDIVREEWLRTALIRPEIVLDGFIIMPNHLHGIIFITNVVGADGVESSVGAHGRAPQQRPLLYRPAKSLGSFVAGYKSIVTKRINILRTTPGMPVWQRNYYEHTIRNDQEMNRIRDYIRNNPLRWTMDHDDPSS